MANISIFFKKFYKVFYTFTSMFAVKTLFFNNFVNFSSSSYKNSRQLTFSKTTSFI